MSKKSRITNPKSHIKDQSFVKASEKVPSTIINLHYHLDRSINVHVAHVEKSIGTTIGDKFELQKDVIPASQQEDHEESDSSHNRITKIVFYSLIVIFVVLSIILAHVSTDSYGISAFIALIMILLVLCILAYTLFKNLSISLAVIIAGLICLMVCTHAAKPTSILKDVVRYLTTYLVEDNKKDTKKAE